MSEVLTERFEMRLSKSDAESLDDLRRHWGYKYKVDLIRYLINKEIRRIAMVKGVKNASK